MYYLFSVFKTNMITLLCYRYSHGAVVPLSDLKDALEPNFSSIKIGSRILLKLKPPDGEVNNCLKKYNLF